MDNALFNSKSEGVTTLQHRPMSPYNTVMYNHFKIFLYGAHIALISILSSIRTRLPTILCTTRGHSYIANITLYLCDAICQ